MYKKSLKKEIMIPAITVTVLSIILISTTILLLFNANNKRLSDEYLVQIGENYARAAKEKLDASSAYLKGIADLTENAIALETQDRETVLKWLETALENQEHVLAVYVAFEPNSFDNADNLYQDTALGNAEGRFALWHINTGAASGWVPLTNTVLDATDTLYYQVPKRTSQAYIDTTYTTELQGYNIYVSYPIKDEAGNFIGVVGFDVDNRYIANTLAGATLFKTGYISMVTKDGVICQHPDTQYIGRRLTDYYAPEIAAAYEKTVATQEKSKIVTKLGNRRIKNFILPITVGTDNQLFYFIASVPMLEYTATLYFSIVIAVVAMLLAALLAGAILSRITHKLLNPLIAIAEAANQMVDTGDTSINLDNSNIKDNEIGYIYQSFIKTSAMMNEWASIMDLVSKGDYSFCITARSENDVFSNSLNRMIATQRMYIENISFVMDSIAKGELDITIDTAYEGAFSPIKDSINTTVDHLRNYMGEIIRILNNIAQGYIHEQIELDFVGDFHTLKESINKMIQMQQCYIANISTVMSRLEKGDLNATIDMDYQGDYAPIKTSIEQTVRQLRLYIDEISHVLHAIAQGDLTQTINVPFSGDFIELKESIQLILSALQVTLFHVNEAANQVSIGSEHMALGAISLSDDIVHQANELANLSDISQNIAFQLSEDAKNAEIAIDSSQQTKMEVDAGNKKMLNLVNAMAQIHEASTKIGKINETIEDIAFQTNLLALNASVEAAHAGASGKGFGIVADEVRRLALSAAQAATDTETLIQATLNLIDNGNVMVKDMADSLREIVEKTDQTTEFVDKIAVATHQHAKQIRSIDAGINTISDVIQSSSSASEVAAAASQELSSQAATLKGQIEKFKLNP